MKSLIKSSYLTLAAILIASFSYSQALMPQPSSGQTIIQDFGLGKVTVIYSRPDAKGRKVFGNLVPYNEVWRTGANNATSITFTDEVMLAGNKVPAGTYGLFTIPTENEWTIILNKTAQQWGSYDYKKDDDVLRIQVKPSATTTKTETFTIQFANVAPASMHLNLSWENTALSIPLTVDLDTKVMANIEKAMAGEKKPYFAAAQYYYTNNKDLKQALAWVSEAEKADGKAPWIKLWKAKILLKIGDKKAAAVTATEGLNLAKQINNKEYIKLNQELLDSTK
ncbi:DUF2911 domain-containing protein [Pedobacter alpinus]|uniref:DUF2911 domain-containing protein n=1 Tax=Pedobacter alpinus TaxID=1590643 RepID=A0ABW5TM50_9SPHI